MYLRVQNDVVRRNVEIFKIIVKRASHSLDTLPVDKKTQDFTALVHRVSGEVRFSDLSSEPLDSRDWVLLSFVFSLPEEGKEPLSFVVSDKKGVSFSWDGLQPQAVGVLKETVKTIQLMTKFLSQIGSLTHSFREFSQINLESFLEEMPSNDLIHEAWYQIGRERCERVLLQKIPGTFLFRQDEFALLLEEGLMSAHQKKIKCITLSYLDAQQRVKDVTLVKKKEGWVLYDNDPCLRGPIYPSVKALLDRFKTSLKTPLLSF